MRTRDERTSGVQAGGVGIKIFKLQAIKKLGQTFKGVSYLRRSHACIPSLRMPSSRRGRESVNSEEFRKIAVILISPDLLPVRCIQQIDMQSQLVARCQILPVNTALTQSLRPIAKGSLWRLLSLAALRHEITRRLGIWESP